MLLGLKKEGSLNLSFGILSFQTPSYCGRLISTERSPVSSLFCQLELLMLFIVVNARVLVPRAAFSIHLGILVADILKPKACQESLSIDISKT